MHKVALSFFSKHTIISFFEELNTPTHTKTCFSKLLSKNLHVIDIFLNNTFGNVIITLNVAATIR